MPTPRRKLKPKPSPFKPHRMTAAEYFTFRRSQVAAQAHTERERSDAQERSQFHAVSRDETERKELLKKLRPGFHWVTIHWLVPQGTGFRAHCISGRVKEVKRGKVEIWVHSKPDEDETALHGIVQGDILTVPVEDITGVSEPVEGT